MIFNYVLMVQVNDEIDTQVRERILDKYDTGDTDLDNNVNTLQTEVSN